MKNLDFYSLIHLLREMISFHFNKIYSDVILKLFNRQLICLMRVLNVFGIFMKRFNAYENENFIAFLSFMSRLV